LKIFFTNFIVAFIWLGLSSERNVTVFLTGFVIGFIILTTFKALFEDHSYLRRIHSFINYIFAFIKAFIMSNITIAMAVMFRRVENIHPNIITIDSSGLSDFEILLLAQSITLTPGTTTIDISEDKNTIFIHAFDGQDPESVRRSIEKDLKAPMLRFTR